MYDYAAKKSDDICEDVCGGQITNVGPEHQQEQNSGRSDVEIEQISASEPVLDEASSAKAPGNLPPRPTKKKKVTPSSTTESPRESSQIWMHFTRLKPDYKRAACNYCGATYAALSRMNGTSTLWVHFNDRCVKNPYRQVSGQTTLDKFRMKKEQEEQTHKSKPLNIAELRRDVAKMIIIDELPFKFIEGEGFQILIEKLEPRFVVPSRITIARDCMTIYNIEKKKLKMILKSERICLTTDTWSSIQNLNYMCLTAHWIGTDWKLNKRILAFCQVPNHKGETIGKNVEDSLNQWGIDKFFTLTVDNATSNDGAIRYLKKRTKDWKYTIASHEFLHVRCCAHILNLIVKEGLEEQNESIVKIRNAVRYVRSSPARFESFKKCVDQEKIEHNSFVCLDVETRWNSTYLMLESAEKFRKAFERLEEEDLRYNSYFNGCDNDDNEDGSNRKGKGSRYLGPPTLEDWENTAYFVKFLILFYNVTLKFSSSLYVTANVFFHEMIAVQTRLMQLTNTNDTLLRLMAVRMKSKFDKYWGNFNNMNLLLFVAVVLDPRYKTKYVKFCLANLYEDDHFLINAVMDKVEHAIKCLYDYYAKFDASCNAGVNHSSRNSNGYSIDVDQNDSDDTLLYLASQFAKHLEEQETIECKSDIVRYLSDACEKQTTSFDVLEWWKVNAMKYPLLSQVARDVLAIQVSTVASESAFSTSGRILDPFRSSLSPKMVEALVCTQNWLRSSPIKIDFEQIAEEIKSYEAIEKETMESNSSTAQEAHNVD